MSSPVTRAELGSLRSKIFYGFGSIAFENIRILNEPEAEIAVAVAAAPPAQ